MVKLAWGGAQTHDLSQPLWAKDAPWRPGEQRRATPLPAPNKGGAKATWWGVAALWVQRSCGMSSFHCSLGDLG